jgi:cyclopropane fatty-acyl-phospholipid synthase-like methyltransferase
VSEEQKLAPYFPTPHSIVERVLKLAELRSGEHVFDLGSGDGRILIIAAKQFGADATGIEIDEGLVKQSTAEIRRQDLSSRARVVQGDMTAQDYSSADVVTVYLLPAANRKVRPLLEKQLKKGARVVAHDFEIDGWTPDRTVHVEDEEGRSHSIFLYRR